MTQTFTEFDPAEFLETPESIAEFLNEALAVADAAYIAKALGVVARAKGMSSVADQTGLSREQLYKTFSEQGNPTLKTLLALTQVLNLNLSVTPR
ncbi:addiction module antidote protein [Oceanobacter kriegii]|uniref:addiction module antidote protein n=1 Tax=Oceanobacter kriegii TaxID=64972 RepID=UPI0004152281|nr:addiction module antidote protein [Oceanobacter kriegii]